MFSVQMPVSSADSSIESNFSEIGRPVESENYQDKGKFNNIFESASTDYKEKMNTKKSIDKQIQKKTLESDISTSKLKSENEKKLLKNTDKNLFHKNVKLLSLKKGKVAKSNSKNTKIRKKILLVKSSQNPVLAGLNEGLKVHNPSTPGSFLKMGRNGQNVTLQPSPKLDSVHKSKVIVDTHGVEDKSPLFQITDSSMRKISSKKDNIDKKSVKIKKSDSKKSQKSRLSVIDLREKGINSHNSIKKSLAKDFNSQKAQSDSANLLHSENQDSAKPIVIELTHIKDNFSSESKTLTSSSDSALMKQLEESINSKIVKQSSVILKDSDAGEIKLILKPEQLGKVRIKLNMQDNRITGHIIVDNASVKEIFENNLHNLERAFRENGFDTAALNVSVGGNHSDRGDKEEGSGIRKQQIEMIDENIPTVYSDTDNLIDLVV